MSNGLILTTVVVAVGSNEASKVMQGKAFQVKPVIGGFALGLFLFAMSAAVPTLASKFCVLIIVAALLYNGGNLFNLIAKASNPITAVGGSTGKGASGAGGGGGGGGGV